MESPRGIVDSSSCHLPLLGPLEFSDFYFLFIFLFIAFQSDHSTVTRTFGAVNFSHSQHVLKLCFNIPE